MTVTNKQLVKAFTAAKELLWDGKTDDSHAHTMAPEYICHALDKARIENNITWIEYKSAKQIITDAIAPWHSLETWLNRAVKLPEERKKRKLALQIYRREWLDHLIKEFSE